MKDILACDTFIEALNDGSLIFKICQHEPFIDRGTEDMPEVGNT